MYESKWYNLSPNVQKNYVLIISIMQQPLAFDGFYVIHLNLKTFKKVRVQQSSFQNSFFAYTSVSFQLVNNFVSYFMVRIFVFFSSLHSFLFEFMNIISFFVSSDAENIG